ncbi:MAG: ABC transporter permease, partial [Pseudomonadota bacterium]
MSGSFRKRPAAAPPTYEPVGYGNLDDAPRTAPPAPPAPPRASDADPTTAPYTSPKSRDDGLDLPPLPPPGDFDVAPASTRDGQGRSGHAPIVPARSVTGNSLTLVISIMCFLACLTAGAVYLMNQSAAAWLQNIASEVTVQIEADEKADIEARMLEVNAYLRQQRGIAATTIIPQATSRALLEPWLGSSDALEALPIPRLIAIQIDRNQPPDFETVRGELTKRFTGVSLDDHRQWQRQIKTVTNSFALGGLAILLLVGAATTAIIVSATRSAMLS